VTERITQVSEKVLEQYFGPAQSRQFEPGTFVTAKRIYFYDTDMISEHQRDWLWCATIVPD